MGRDALLGVWGLGCSAYDLLDTGVRLMFLFVHLKHRVKVLGSNIWLHRHLQEDEHCIGVIPL
jgi:hypothetical protein